MVRSTIHPLPSEQAGAGFDALLEWLCPGMGYCGGPVDGEPRHLINYLPEAGEVAAEDFAHWAFLAEGHKVSRDEVLRHPHGAAIRDAFIHFMGRTHVGADRFA